MYEKELSYQLKRADYDAMLRVVSHNELSKEPDKMNILYPTDKLKESAVMFAGKPKPKE